MIQGYLGMVGSGKTCSAVREAYRYFLKGYTVYANIWLKFPHKPMNKEVIKEMVHNKQLKNCVILLDEIGVFLDSRMSMSKKNRLFSYFLAQTRKRSVRLLWTSQFSTLVDKRLRKLTDTYVDCFNLTTKKSIIEGNLPVRICQFIQHQYTRIPTRRSIYVANRYFDLYNTDEIVDFFDD